jgi:hypothetical protein
MPAYISARFEKTLLSTSDQVRVIVRNLDQGDVPPAPSVTYFPTQPSGMQTFIVGEYVNDTVGERFKRVASLADTTGITSRALDTFDAALGNFVVAGVAPGDILEITLPDATLWTSEEYPTASPFQFSVVAVVSPTRLRVAQPFPAFGRDLTWSIPARSINNTDGITHRNGNPVGPVEFLDRRFNTYFLNALDAENFVSAAKASLDTLANEGTGSALTNESYTAGPT